MNRYLLICLTLLTSVMLMAAVPADAQTGGITQAGIDKINSEIDRTDQMIERTENAPGVSDNDQAKKALDVARDLQQQAKDKFNDARYAWAYTLTIKAREMLLVAIKLAGSSQNSSEQQDGFVASRLERAADKLERAKEAIEGEDNPALNAIYEAAKDNLARAWEFYRDKRYVPALKMADQVEKAAQKLTEIGSEREHDTGDFDRRKENVSQIIEQISQALSDCGSATAKSFLDEAQKALQLADDLKERRPGAALQALQRARELAMRAERECKGEAQLGQRYDRLQSKVEQLKASSGSLSGSAKDSFDKLISQAEEQLGLADSYIRDGSWEKATAALQAAQLSIRQAEGLLERIK